jgi:hypothetical protein
MLDSPCCYGLGIRQSCGFLARTVRMVRLNDVSGANDRALGNVAGAFDELNLHTETKEVFHVTLGSSQHDRAGYMNKRIVLFQKFDLERNDFHPWPPNLRRIIYAKGQSIFYKI